MSPFSLSTHKRLWIGLVLGFLIALATAFGGKPLFRAIKHQRALSILEDAKSLEAAQETQKAIEKAYAAYKLAPHEPRVARYIAQIVQSVSPSNAIDFWITLTDQTKEIEDLNSTINLALQLGQSNIAEKYLEILKAKDPNGSKTLVVESKFYATKGQFDLAATKAFEATHLTNAPPEANPLYIQFSQMAKQPLIRSEGLEHLRALAMQKNQEGLDALRTLATYPNHTPEEIEELMHRLHDHPLAQAKDHLLALSLGQRIGQVDQNTVFAQAEMLFKNASMEDKVNLGRWLNAQGAYTKTTHCVTLEEALMRSDLFLVWGDAMALSNQWEDLQKALEKPDLPLDEALRHLFLARTAEALKNPLKADYEWNKALMEAGKNPDKIKFIIQYATKLKAYTYASKGLSILTTIPTTDREAWVQWVNLGVTAKDTQNVLKVLQKMAANYPKDEAVENDLRYVQALKGPVTDKSLARAQLLVTEYPMVLAYRMTLSLAFIRNQEPQKAYDLLKDFPVDWLKIQTRWRALYIGILKANERAGLAAIFEVNLDWNSLLPEEAQFAREGKLL
jgi:hypothetical protein